MRSLSAKPLSTLAGLFLVGLIPLISGCPETEVPEPGAVSEAPATSGGGEAETGRSYENEEVGM